MPLIVTGPLVWGPGLKNKKSFYCLWYLIIIFHSWKPGGKITQEFFKDISHLKILINKNIWFLNQDFFLGVIQGTGAICFSQILISFPFVFLNNRNKVMGIKLRHRENDPSHWLSQPCLTVLLCDKCLSLSSIIYQREINCIWLLQSGDHFFSGWYFKKWMPVKTCWQWGQLGSLFPGLHTRT